MSKLRFINIIAAVALFMTANTFAQTSSFVYQGKLHDGVLAANGNYQFEFRLYDAATGGNLVGQAVTGVNTMVIGGVFAVDLDFGAAAFNGETRFIDISVRLASSSQPYTPLNPRQRIASTPYAVRSSTAETATTATNAVSAMNSSQLGGINADQYVTGPVVRSINNMANDVTITAGPNITITPVGNTLTIASTGSAAGIQNQTTQQAGANFNIDGKGTANIVNAATHYQIGGSRVFHLTGTDNTFMGAEGGNSLTTGSFNASFGSFAGRDTTTGINNAFFGAYAGRGNIIGGNNSFFGSNAGLSNKASLNSFFGSGAGLNNQTGAENTFVGAGSGLENTTGLRNVAVGKDAGKNNTTGAFNTYIGALSGANSGQITGTSNTVVGYNASVAPNVSFATAIGESAFANQNNQVAIGTAASTVRISGKLDVNNDTSINGFLTVADLGGNGSVPLCRNSGNFIATCAGNRPIDDVAELRLQINRQQAQIDALKVIVCSAKPDAGVCQSAKP